MNFFGHLRKRTERLPDSRVENALFRKLDAEFARDFGKEEKNGFLESFGLASFFRWAPMAAAAVLLAVLGTQMDRANRPRAESGIVALGAFESEILSEGGDYEFYDEMDDWVLSATDEDWEILNGPQDS